MAQEKLEAAIIRRLAVRASCSPITIQKVWLGLPVRGLAGHRARAAHLEARLAPPLSPVDARAGQGGAQ